MSKDPFNLRGNEYPKVRAKKIANQEQFKQYLAEAIEENNGIATVLDAHNCALKVFKKYPWSTQNIESISRFIMTCPEFFRIDLQIKNSKPLAIFPGHHKISSTSFFVTRKEDQTEDVVKAENLLDSLIETAKENLKNRGKSLKDKEKEEEPELPALIEENNTYTLLTENDEEITDKAAPKAPASKTKTCHATLAKHNGFISATTLRLALLHEYIARQFAYNEFTHYDVVNQMPMDLYNKIVGIERYPPVLLNQPLLTKIIVGCFPDRILDAIQIKYGYDEIKRLLNILSGTSPGHFSHIVLECTSASTFRLMSTATIEIKSTISFTYQLARYDDVTEFWRMSALCQLLCYVDPHSNPIWRKRHSIFSDPAKTKQNTTGKAIVNNFLSKGLRKSFPLTISKLENFVAKAGLNYTFLESYLKAVFNGPRKDDVASILHPKLGLIALYCLGETPKEEKFKYSPLNLKDTMLPSAFSWLKDAKAHIALNYITSLFTVTPRGVIAPTPRRWNTIYDMIVEYGNPTEEELKMIAKPHGAHTFSMCFHRDYRDLYNYNIAMASNRARRFEPSEDEVTLNTSQYNIAMSLQRLSWSLSPQLGEVVERLKVISLCPRHEYAAEVAEELLTEIGATNALMNEAVLLLKYTKFLSQPREEDGDADQPYRFSSRNIVELKQRVPVSYLADFLHDMNAIHGGDYTSPSLDGIITSKPGSCANLLGTHTNAVVSVRPELLVPPPAEQLSGRRRTANAVPLNKQADREIFTIEIAMQPLPILPALPTPDAPPEDFSISKERPLTDFRAFPGTTCPALHNAYMQCFVLLYQLTGDTNLDFLLFARLVYSHILFRFMDGIGLDKLVDHFGAENMTRVIDVVIFLEQFEFITRVHSTCVMPHFVADLYGPAHQIVRNLLEGTFDVIRPHYWIDINGGTQSEIIEKLSSNIVDHIREFPGIELTELAERFTSVPLSDLYALVDVLEADEVLTTTFTRTVQGGLEDSDTEIACGRVSPILYLYELGHYADEPDMPRVKRWINLTANHMQNFALSTYETCKDVFSSLVF